MKILLSGLRAIIQEGIVNALKESYGVNPQNHGSDGHKVSWISQDWQTGPLKVTAEVSGLGMHIEARLISIQKNGKPINFDQWLTAENQAWILQGEDAWTEEQIMNLFREEAIEAAEGAINDHGLDRAEDARNDAHYAFDNRNNPDF